MGKIKKALKDEEFRKLFMDYANEISDPENKKVSPPTLSLLLMIYNYSDD